jgi:hypothetical protein
MAIGSKVSGNFKSASGLFAKVDGGWKKAKFGYVKVAGEWKQFWADKLEDLFNRADTTSGLGAADSGQGWTILRSQWQINSNAAKTTGSKSDYPLASIDAGFLEFDLQANELTPGTGVAIRVTDANNWWGVLPYYNQTSQTYTYCVQSRPVSYCITACTEPYDYTLRCDPPNTETTTPIYDFTCPGGYELLYYDEWVEIDCVPPTPSGRIVQNCVTEPYDTVNCEWVYQIGRGVVRVCTPGTGTRQVCTNTWEDYPCEPVYDLQETYIEYCPSGEVFGQIGTEYECAPDGYTNVPLYACCQAGSYNECIQSATGTSYTNYFYLQIVKMVNGVFSVVESVQVPDRWSAVKISANGTNMTVNAYTDSLYTNQIGTYTTSEFLATGTGYGVVARPSNFEDGRTIGSLIVKPLGQ